MTGVFAVLRGRPRVLVALLALLVVVVGYGVIREPAPATHQPADKVAASGRLLKVFAPGVDKELLQATVRTSKPTDLILAVSLECSILTKLTTGPSAKGGSSTAEASGEVRVWIEIDDPSHVVPIASTSQPPQNPPVWGTKAADGVTFCNRTYHRTVTDTEDPQDGQDTNQDFIDTKSANAFNWLRLNLGSGVHTITVKADLTRTPACASDTTPP